MPEEINSPADDFAPPWVEVLPDGTELKFIPHDMDHWAETCQGLTLAREKEEREKLAANASLSPADREGLLQRVRKDKVGISYAMWYRGEDPTGIKVGLRRALVASWGVGKTPAEQKEAGDKADAYIRRLKPTTKIRIANYLVDPYPLTTPKPGDDDPKKESVLTSGTGPKTDSSSAELSPESIPEA